ncbi:hypothetical protein E308F_27080 [Moorella sp. E308F]|jgi:hypothetical protein|uniref:hypothetical protein n=1 Tax=unclassified Neomoorella TaxID=2676739 RepID=UPI0010FFB971|nr:MULTISPECIES: hypothetical protein [unclassified Moorella (in: firmicutes)]MDK2895123.1 hypothetical protein [Moorella sp. (in: firmicutes)]GEA16462.1 hypothetical protein E308F_27080 [Moorella sp. E308F]GEA17360.1 hypothetical protein E306M_04940 [Moorella sp. E306M]
MPEKPGAAKERPEKEATRKGLATEGTRGTAYEFGTEIATPGTNTPGTARGTAGAVRGRDQKRPAGEE